MSSNEHTEHCIQSIKHDVFSGLGDLLNNNDCHEEHGDGFRYDLCDVNFIINYIDDINNKDYKTLFDLLTECTNCESITRIIIILRGYISICDTLKFKNIYTLTQIHDDFIHIKEHIDTETYDNIPSMDYHVKQYVGKKEDEKWWEYNIAETDEDIYFRLIKKIGVFRWQSFHGFRSKQHQASMHLRPKYHNVKEEAFYNPYYPLSPDNWNQTLRKDKIFHDSFERKRKYDKITQEIFKLYTDFDGKYDDKITRAIFIFIFKLYTDCDGKYDDKITREIFKLYTDFDGQCDDKIAQKIFKLYTDFDGKYDDKITRGIFIFIFKLYTDFDGKYDDKIAQKIFKLDNWNQTLRKRIRTSKYDDKITQETINLSETVMFKLYTDFDKLQYELKKCFITNFFFT